MAALTTIVIGVAVVGFVVQQRNASAQGQSFDTFKQRQLDAATTPVVPSRPKPSPSTRPPEPEAPWPTGIFEDHEAPAYSGDFLATNRWTGMVNGNHIDVYAGQAGEDQETGMLLVMVLSAGQSDATGKSLRVPSSGPLRLVSVSGNLLTIHPQHGPDRVFNIDTLKFT